MNESLTTFDIPFLLVLSGCLVAIPVPPPRRTSEARPGRAPGDRFMCPSYWASWWHALRAEARQKPCDPEALYYGLRGRYGAAARGRGIRPRLRPPSVQPGVACLPKENIGYILRLGCHRGGVLGFGRAQGLGGWERRRRRWQQRLKQWPEHRARSGASPLVCVCKCVYRDTH
jgi:hypothetical protein